jgi:hypothetical protein
MPPPNIALWCIDCVEEKAFFFLLLICAYNVWVISPHLPRPLSQPPYPTHYQAVTILPLSLILL